MKSSRDQSKMTVILFEIQRFNPEKDSEPRYKKYAVDIPDNASIIMVLRKIKDKADGSLTFRKGCGCAICGTCAMRVDGKPVLACKTKVKDVVGDMKQAEMDREVVRIEPLTNSKIIKDLVIDEDHFWEQLYKVMPWLEKGSADPEAVVLPKDVDAMEKAQDCIHCHACTSGCDTFSVDQSYLGPEAFVKSFSLVKDPRDGVVHKRLTAVVDGGLWNCVRAYTCIDACPKGIDPAEIISRMHELSVDYGVANPRAERHAHHFVKSLKKTGKLDEKMMPVKTLGLGVIGFVPDTFKMMKRGKLPPIFNKKIAGQKEVWTLVELAKDKKEEKNDDHK